MLKHGKLINRLGMAVVLIQWLMLPRASSESEWWRRWLVMSAALLAWALFLAVLAGIESAWKAHRDRERGH